MRVGLDHCKPSKFSRGFSDQSIRDLNFLLTPLLLLCLFPELLKASFTSILEPFRMLFLPIPLQPHHRHRVVRGDAVALCNLFRGVFSVEFFAGQML